MRLLITTPTAVIVDERDVVAVRAEDESGSFGILDGHADFLTALTVSVVSWHRADDRQTVLRGAARRAVGHQAAAKSRSRHAKRSPAMISPISNASCWRNSAKRSKPSEWREPRGLQLQMQAIRQIVRYLRPERPGLFGGGS